jgi:uncharacterized protein with NRDE domain
MCLITLAWRFHPDYPLVLAANRDEWHARPAEPLSWWRSEPPILAGRDVRGGGTWLGVRRDGRFAALTNYRDPGDERPAHAPSRGALVVATLARSEGLADTLAGIAHRGADYAGFNLIAGDADAAYAYSNRAGQVQALAPGIHGLSNHLIDTPWPKVRRATEGLAQVLATSAPGDLLQRLFGLLADATVAPDEELPDTGVGIAWERKLSPIRIHGEHYGTRCSTVLLRHATGQIALVERTLDSAGRVTGEVANRFCLDQIKSGKRRNCARGSPRARPTRRFR